MSETQNQFSLTCAASMNRSGADGLFPIAQFDVLKKPIN
jgi:hypothetical protein